jgi:hypothetical protein
MEEEMENHYDDDHPKKRLRIDAYWDIVNSCRATLSDRLWLRNVLYKAKKNEILPADKVMRMIGDLGVAASLQGFVLTKFVKSAMAAEPFDYLGGTIEFCPSPSPDSLERIFKNLVDPPGRYYFIYFSDDASYSVRRPDGSVCMFNVDISKCDASHTKHVWKALRATLPPWMHDDYDRLVGQLLLPIKVYDVTEKNRRCYLKPKGPKLYSGSTLTTVTNNMANLLIAMSLAESEADNADKIIESAEAAGYIYKVQTCDDLYDLQFLKHSPVYDVTGRMRAVLNIGVLLRMTGTCKGDLPGRGDLEARAREFQFALLRGAYPRVHSPLIDGMKNSCAVEEVRQEVQLRVDDHIGLYRTAATEDHFTVDSHELLARYRLTGTQEKVFVETLGSMEFEEAYSDDSTAAILMKDYEITTSYL